MILRFNGTHRRQIFKYVFKLIKSNSSSSFYHFNITGIVIPDFFFIYFPISWQKFAALVLLVHFLVHCFLNMPPHPQMPGFTKPLHICEANYDPILHISLWKTCNTIFGFNSRTWLLTQLGVRPQMASRPIVLLGDTDTYWNYMLMHLRDHIPVIYMIFKGWTNPEQYIFMPQNFHQGKMFCFSSCIYSFFQYSDRHVEYLEIDFPAISQFLRDSCFY